MTVSLYLGSFRTRGEEDAVVALAEALFAVTLGTASETRQPAVVLTRHADRTALTFAHAVIDVAGEESEPDGTQAYRIRQVRVVEGAVTHLGIELFVGARD